jgi:hypothetical protein
MGVEIFKASHLFKENDQLVSPFLIVYNVTGVKTDGFQTYDLARIKEIPKKLFGGPAGQGGSLRFDRQRGLS